MRDVVLATCLTIVALCGCQSMRADHRNIEQLSGEELYERLCSSCHGVKGHGDGPVAPLIKGRVPNLTILARMQGGEFPTEDIRRSIDGRWDRRAHGARDMPVWGWQLYDMSSANDAQERAQVDSMIDRLVNYLASVQQP